MKYVSIGILAGVAVAVLAVSVALALPSNRGIEKAAEVSPAIEDDGTVRAPPEFVAQLPESQLSKVFFIRYAPGKAPACDNDGVCEKKENWKNCPNDCKKGNGEEPPETTCYGFLAGSKPHWNWVEDYYYADSSLAGPTANAVATWEAATASDIFGNGIAGVYPWDVYDLKNSISYGDYKEADVIAVASLWFRGKNIYEYDILYDTDYFPGGSVDLDTVVLHEQGHGAGLNDLYDTVCATEVMYGIYDGVDLDLGPGDTAGIQTLYGP